MVAARAPVHFASEMFSLKVDVASGERGHLLGVPSHHGLGHL